MSVSEAARVYGLSRPTVRDWRERYLQGGEEALADRSRAPKTSPSRTDDEIAQQLIAERRKWGFGSQKILQRLAEEYPDVEWPARSTVDEIFARAGLTRPRRRRERKRVTPFVRQYPAEKPGELWTIDYKGQFRLKNGRLCYPLTVVDRVSRYVIACQALGSTQLEPTWAVIERSLREWGLPDAMQSDNGPPFGGQGWGRLSTLSVRLMKLGILPVFSRPGKPQDNGAHERMHRELKDAATIPPGKHLKDQQKKLDAFRQMYNHERPHGGLGMSRPARLWKGSRRCFPRRIEPFTYERWFEVRKVARSGMLDWGKVKVFISHALAGEEIALEPALNDRLNLYFRSFFLGQLDQQTRTLI